MSFVTLTMWTVKCDECGTVFEGEDYVAWSDASSAVDMAEASDWVQMFGKHFCPDHDPRIPQGES